MPTGFARSKVSRARLSSTLAKESEDRQRATEVLWELLKAGLEAIEAACEFLGQSDWLRDKFPPQQRPLALIPTFSRPAPTDRQVDARKIWRLTGGRKDSRQHQRPTPNDFFLAIVPPLRLASIMRH